MNATSRAPSTALTRVLLVDGDPSDHRLIADHLDAVPTTRFLIDWARSLAEARDRVAQGQFDVCLLEPSLPDGDGLDLLASADLLGSMMPVIILTGLPSAEQDRQAMALGAAAFLEKIKLDPTTLARVIRYSMHQRKIINGSAHMAFRDEATGLISHALLRERLERAFAFARRRDRDVAVMMIELAFDDRDDRNADLIDPVLHEAGRRLARKLRETDSIARLPGRRLALLVEGMRSLHHTASVARKVLQTLRTPIDIDGHAVDVSPSIGVAIYPHEDGEADGLMRKAEAAMHLARAEDAEGCRFGSERIDSEAREGMILDKAFRIAFGHRELRLRFHPDIRLNGQLNGLGGEIFWRHPERGWLPLERGLCDTDDEALFKGIADWCLASAAEHLLTWRGQGLALPRLSLAMPFSHRPALSHLCRAVEEQIHARKLKADLIELDLPENLIIDDISRGASDLCRLKGTGVRLALDGFGRARIAIQDLQRDVLSGLKIAESFCHDLQGDDQGESLLRALVNLGHDLGLEVTAKGARDQQQLAFLKRLGCDSVQLSAGPTPMSGDAATIWLRTTLKPPAANNRKSRVSPEIIVPKDRPLVRTRMKEPSPAARD